MSSPTSSVSVERDLNTIFTNVIVRPRCVMFNCLADTTEDECDRKMNDLGFANRWQQLGNKVIFWRDYNTSDDEDDDDNYNNDDRDDDDDNDDDDEVVDDEEDDEA
jgi:hypothetical protein